MGGVHDFGSCLPARTGRCDQFEPDQNYACIDPDSSDPICAPGCRVCDDAAALTGNGIRVGAYNAGRWLRPHQTFLSRDAWGRFSALRSAVPALLPNDTVFERSPCFFLDGRECFDDDYCDCHPTASEVSVLLNPFRCCDFTPDCQKMRSSIGDCHAYAGNSFPPYLLACRGVQERGVLNIPLGFAGLRQINTVRLGNSKVCTGNGLISCTARVVPSQCDGSFAAHHEDFPQEFYYGGGEDAERIHHFNLVSIDSLDPPSLRANPLGDEAVLDVKNRALTRVFETRTNPFPGGQNGTHFDQLESVHFRHPIGFGNAFLGLWDREWDGPQLVRDEELSGASVFPLLLNLPQCKLRNSGVAVSVDLIVVRAKMTLDLVAHQQGNSRADLCARSSRELFPSARVQLRIELGARATFTGEGPFVLDRPWLKDSESLPLELLNPADGDGFPTVQGRIDELVYIHPDGDRFVPPRVVEWWGNLGAFSVPGWGNRWSSVFPCVTAAGLPLLRPDGLNIYCPCLARSLNGTTVPGWPSQLDSNPSDPNQIYDGNVVLGFR